MPLTVKTALRLKTRRLYQYDIYGFFIFSFVFCSFSGPAEQLAWLTEVEFLAIFKISRSIKTAACANVFDKGTFILFIIEG
ncbi:hypothetical protein [Thalassomonas haliotis]|uniref:Uncharacterized protein n=1 Tax=Thalassomonas haliotis TaxID=485448 RepID=A0ABY7VMT8_9GAMM|nr:hypothetical protein [Thalassomonas haliotis]WDE14198.1 hypothetical protein H3N35_12745 [Thalassomonas haliotis]